MLSIRRLVPFTLVITSIIGWGFSAPLQQEADLLLTGGKIITVDSAFSIRSAMAVGGGRILAVGNDRDMDRYRGDSTRVVDLRGRTVIPGLIDSHSHAASAAMTEFDHPVPTMETIQDVLDYIASRAEILEDGEWIWVAQVFLTRLAEERYPTREELDRAAPRNPAVFRTGPDASVNSLALELSGIGKDWEVDDGGPGHAEKDPETGELTGILRGCTRYLKYESAGIDPTTEQELGRIQELMADYNRVGITTLAERGAQPWVIERYRTLEKKGELTARVYLSRRLNTIQPLEEIEKTIAEVAASPHFRSSGLVRTRAVKTALDGGMLTGSAYMRQPWGVSQLYGITDPEYRGLRFIAPEKLEGIMSACMERDVQFTSHCVGDGAVHAFIDASRKLSERFDIRAKRPVICHSNFMSPESVASLAEMGIGADIQPAWLYLDGRTLRNHFGIDRLQWFQPLRSLFAAGAIVGGGSDHMQKIGSRRSINFYNPWMGMWVSLTRQARWLDQPLRPEQALTRVEALRFYTINNAWLLFAEDEIGSLEAGKSADFVILEKDPLTARLDELKDFEVAETYLQGRRVY